MIRVIQFRQLATASLLGVLIVNFLSQEPYLSDGCFPNGKAMLNLIDRPLQAGRLFFDHALQYSHVTRGRWHMAPLTSIS